MGQMARVTNDPANYLAVGHQASKDTEATTFYFVKQLNGSGFQLAWNQVGEREGGDGQEIGLRYKDQIKGHGAININARYGAMGRVFAWIMGQETVASQAIPSSAITGGPTAIQIHTANPVASEAYLTVEQRFADEMERADNVLLTSIVIEGSAGKPLKCMVQFDCGGTIAQRDVSSALTPVREYNRPWFYPYGSYVFDGFASYSGKVTKFKIEFNRHVDDTIQTVGLNREDVLPLNYDVNFDATIKYETRDFYQKIAYLSGSQVQPDFATGSFQLNAFTSGAAIVGPYTPAVATGYLLQVNLPFLQYIDGKVNKLDPDGKTMYLDFVAASVRNPNGTPPIWTQVYTDDSAAY